MSGADRGPGLLRRLLRELEEAAPGEGLPQIAARLGISPAEAADLAGYWVRKGRIRREEIGAPECAGCFFATRGCASGTGTGTCSAPAGPSRPALVALSPVPRPAAPLHPRPALPPAPPEQPR